jgi:hypothetical protein
MVERITIRKRKRIEFNNNEATRARRLNAMNTKENNHNGAEANSFRRIEQPPITEVEVPMTIRHELELRYNDISAIAIKLYRYSKIDPTNQLCKKLGILS